MGFAAVRIQGPDKTYNSAGPVASGLVSVSPGRLYAVVAYNNNVATRYLQIFDATAVPADASVPLIVLALPPGSTGTLDWQDGRMFTSGIVVVNSSTAATKTISGADLIIDIAYRATTV